MTECDKIVAGELPKLVASGRQPSCTKGCAHCCRQEILVPRAEAEAIAEWALNAMSADQLGALKKSLASWLRWYREVYPDLMASGVDRDDAFYSHGPYCPALDAELACSIYPVRPIVCRNHFVTTPADACRPDDDPAYLPTPVAPMTDLVVKTAHLPRKLRVLIENQGGDFKGSVHLLPEWLVHLFGVEAEPWRKNPPPDLSHFS